MELIFIVAPADMKLGVIITIVGIFVVFTSLVVLSIIFNQIPKLLKVKLKRIPKKSESGSPDKVHREAVTGETNAAIATAIYLYFNELHDRESNVMTIEKVSKRYSPWSSKIYGLRNVNLK
jgi:Na+-transporting methylmalonyl-CoA/oxaloacetate decarboxylase gamma subunit